MIIVVHTPKPSSLAHSLQIHCTGLAGLRPHASWAGPEKSDPTIGAVCGGACALANIMVSHSQAPINKNPWRGPFWQWCELRKSPPSFPGTHCHYHSSASILGSRYKVFITRGGSLDSVVQGASDVRYAPPCTCQGANS